MSSTMTSSSNAGDQQFPDPDGVSNKYGYFSADGTEFCITNPKTPRPWSNVIANRRFGVAVSQTGSGFTWVDNSQLAVITRWQQDLTHDSSGKFLYVRDVDSGELWSLSPAPTWCDFDSYVCRHGIGYTTFVTECNGIAAEWTLFCPPEQTAEMWQVELRNMTDRPRRLEVCSYLEWCCGVAPSPRREFHKLFIETEFDAKRGAVIATNHMWDVPSKRHGHWNRDFPYVSGFACTEPVLSATGDKCAFTGAYNDLRAPAALNCDTWKPCFGRHDDAVAAVRWSVDLAGGESQRMGCVLAVAKGRGELEGMLDSLVDVEAIDSLLAQARSDWSDRLSTHRVETPETSLNYLMNDWLRYQAISGRMWGRCGYYQQSGAFGFRDQLQDSQVWLSIDPEKCREQINLHAKHQFADGSVYHWWHPLSEQGLVTTMTDDLLWLGFVTANYIKETGNLAVLDDKAPFLDDETETNIVDHVERAFRRVFKRTSSRGLPYIGAGDWNDGLSAAGLEERGESVWLGHFLAGLLADWADIYDRIGQETKAVDFRKRRAELVAAINKHGWDGDWYIRATLDDGTKLGSSESEVGRIFLNAQTWALLNDVADEERSKKCWEAVKEHLVSEVGALLLTPAFDKPVPEIGYITRYAAGLRENGGVYTHAATWAIAAACKMNDEKTVDALLGAINPALRDPDRYWAEPYVTPGNVDGPESPHFGRGGWSWYTGSAAWLHRVVSEWVLGVRPEWDGLRISPCLPPDWDEVYLHRSYRGNDYLIKIKRRKDKQGAGGVKVLLDGDALPDNLIPAPDGTGQVFKVEVEY